MSEKPKRNTSIKDNELDYTEKKFRTERLELLCCCQWFRLISKNISNKYQIQSLDRTYLFNKMFYAYFDGGNQNL